MDQIYILFLTIVFLIIGYLRFFWKRIKYNLPPGPKGLPYIGNAWQIDQALPFHHLTELSKKYGDIFKIHMYGKNIIVICGDELLQRALVTDSVSFAGRPRHVRIELIRENGFHVSFCDYGPRLRDLKKTLLNCMRMYGDGLQKLEDMVNEMTSELLDACHATQGQPCDMEKEFFAFMMNIMITLACAKRMSREEIDLYVRTERELMPVGASGSAAMIVDLIPWLKYFPLSYIKVMKTFTEKLNSLFDPYIKEREETFDGVNVECLVDAMLKKNIGLTTEEQYKIEDMRAVVSEICGAGILTSTSSLSYFLAQCIVHPEMQKKIQMEIDKNIGTRAPRLSDKVNMPYLEAALFETFRITSNVPLMLPHKTTTDVEIGGYRIPKDTQVWMNSWSLHHDERYWDEPWAFRPERFLSADDGTVVPPDHINRKRMLAFGAGRRVCMGEALAKGRLFLLISTLLQQFNILPESDDKLPDTDPRHQSPGVVLFPPPYKMRMLPRK